MLSTQLTLCVSLVLAGEALMIQPATPHTAAIPAPNYTHWAMDAVTGRIWAASSCSSSTWVNWDLGTMMRTGPTVTNGMVTQGGFSNTCGISAYDGKTYVAHNEADTLLELSSAITKVQSV